MAEWQKSFTRPQPQTKDQLRASLAQAVRNTAPELNPIAVQPPEPMPKRRMRPRSYRLMKRPG